MKISNVFAGDIRSGGREFRVFISSTFLDMERERAYLVAHVFPELRQICRERGVAFIEIDLRWGITERQARRRKIVSTCLDEIHQKQPCIVALVGDRYGWVPGREDLGTDPAVLQRYQWLLPAVDAGRSLVELESLESIRHNRSLRDRIHFYFSGPADGNDPNPDASKVEGFKERVRASGLAPREAYEDLQTLGAWVRRDLLAEIERRFPSMQAPSFMEMERRGHEAFAASRRRVYVEHPATLRKIDEFVAGEQRAAIGAGPSESPDDRASVTPLPSLPLVITGESGSGKSSLLSFWSERYRREHPGAFIITHHVGATATSTGHLGLLRRIMLEIQDRCGVAVEVPTDPEKIAVEFPYWLGYVREESETRNRETSVTSAARLPGLVLVIDALNQLSESSRRSLRWLPEYFPPYVRVIVSALDGDILTELQRRTWPMLAVEPISSEDRAAIVRRCLGSFGKELDTASAHRLVSDPKSISPLFLVATMEELRFSGTHENLDGRIAYLLEAEDLDDLYQRVLERMEKDYGGRLVRDVMSLIHASRNGLSEIELLELTGCGPRKLARLLYGLGDNLLSREGLLGFFHDYLRQGVKRRYLAKAATNRKVHLRLASYFESMEVSERSARELLWQYAEAEEPDRMRELLGRIPMLRVLYHGTTRFEVLSAWKQLLDSGADPEETYRTAMEGFRDEGTSGEVLDGLEKAGDLLLVLGRWRMALDLYDDLARLAGELGATERRADAECAIGSALIARHRYDEALRILEHALGLFEELGDRKGISTAVGNIGRVYWGRDDRDSSDREKAMSSFRRQISICEEIGDRVGLASALGGVGNINAMRSDIDAALICYQRQLEIVEGLGDRRGIASVYHSMGHVLSFRDGERSLQCSRRALAIFQEIGDLSGIAATLGIMAMVYHIRKDFDRAFDCYRRQMSILEELDLPENAAAVASSLGHIHGSRGEFEQSRHYFHRVRSIWDQRYPDVSLRLTIVMVRVGLGWIYCREFPLAFDCFQRALAQYRIRKEYHLESAYCLAGIAEVLIESAGLDGPLPPFLSEEIGDEGSAGWRHRALERAERLAEESVACFEKSSMSYELFGNRILLARIAGAQGDRSGAAARLGALLSEAATDEDRAEIHYRLWQNSADGGTSDAEYEAHRCAALQSYEALITCAPEHKYKLRIELLKAATIPDTIHA